MKARIPIPQIILVGAAVLVGVLLDRLLFAKEAGPSREVVRQVSATENVAPSARSTSSDVTSVPTGEEKESNSATHAESRKNLDAILATKDPRQRNRDLQAYINALTPGQFPDALKRIRQMTSSNERELASRLLVAQWVQNDPEGALQFAAGNRGFEYLAEDVFQQQAANDFQSAMAKAASISENRLLTCNVLFVE